MPEIVTISEHQSDISAKHGAPATATFDVVNVADRPLDVALRVVPDPANGTAVPDWIAVSGEDQFRLDVAETRKCEILIDPPEDVEAGEIAFCLKAFEPALPEENTGLSNIVTANVIALDQPEPTPTRWGLIAAIVAGIAVLIGGGVGGYMMIRGGGDVMPNLAGKSAAEARQMIEAKLGAGAVQQSFIAVNDEYPGPGVVRAHTPETGTAIDETTRVNLRVTAYRMPDVKNQTFDGAVAKLAAADIPADLVKVSRPRGTNENKLVTNQVPGPSQWLPEGQMVTLTIPGPFLVNPGILVPNQVLIPHVLHQRIDIAPTQ